MLRGNDDVVFTTFWELASGRDQPADVIVELLTRFGVVASTGGKVGLSALGGWALDQVAGLTPPVVTATMTAAEVLAAVERLDEALAWRRAARWLGARAPITAARDLLAAAAASPMHRMAALSLVAGLDDSALPAWREVAELPWVGPAARAFLAREFGDPEPTAQNTSWRLVDESVALLDEEGAAGALPDIWDKLPGGNAQAKIISVEATGHPDAGSLIEQLRPYAPPSAVRPAPPVYQLKISLTHMRPPVWRRVQVDLVGVLPRPGLTASYLYDFGDSWRHAVEVEKIHDAEADVTYPRCVPGKEPVPGRTAANPSPSTSNSSITASTESGTLEPGAFSRARRLPGLRAASHVPCRRDSQVAE